MSVIKELLEEIKTQKESIEEARKPTWDPADYGYDLSSLSHEELKKAKAYIYYRVVKQGKDPRTLKKYTQYLVDKGNQKTDQQDDEHIQHLKDIAQQTQGKKRVVKADINKINQGRKVRYRLPTTINSDRYEDLIETVLANMQLELAGESTSRIMLVGSPGSGKTSFMKNLATIFGMNMVIIEATQLTEEKFLNIPYIIYKGTKEIKGQITAQQQKSGEFELVTAESALTDEIKALKPIKETEHNKMLNKSKKLKLLYEKYKDFIEEVVIRKPSEKKGFKTILILDEYFRTGNANIRNLLRTILNGQIGASKLHEGTYIITASNINNEDGSLDTVNMNQQFQALDFDDDYKPTKDDFLAYLADKYSPVDLEKGEESEEKLKAIEEEGLPVIKPEVYNKFAEIISDEDINTDNNGVYLSARRLEQMILYVNEVLPVSSIEEAKALLKFVEVQFTDYVDNEQSNLLDKYMKAVKELIKETSGIDADGLGPATSVEWKNVLEQEIEVAQKAGKARRYPTVLSGMPGTSKTYTVSKLAEEKGMGCIHIDCSTLTIDDTVGIPIPQEDEEGNIHTIFSEPPLYQRIMKRYYEEVNRLKKEEKYQENRAYNVILFLDELTRVKDVQIFNKIRLLLLEKEVGNSNFKLPDDIFIVGAMNPKDEDVLELPEHTKDVLDIIPVDLSIQQVEDFLENSKYKDEEEADLGFPVGSLAIGVLKDIYNRFASDHGLDDEPLIPDVKPFYWDLGGTIIYVSPREIASMYNNIIGNIVQKFKLNKWNEADKTDEVVIAEFIRKAREATFKALKAQLKFNFIKFEVTPAKQKEFLNVLVQMINSNDIFEKTIKVQENRVVEKLSVKHLVERANYDIDTVIDNVDIVETWIISTNGDYTEVKNVFGEVLYDYYKDHDILQNIKFTKDMIRLVNAIDWENIPGKTAYLDSIALIFKDKIKFIKETPEFEEVLFEKQDEEMIKAIEELIDVLNNSPEIFKTTVEM